MVLLGQFYFRGSGDRRVMSHLLNWMHQVNALIVEVSDAQRPGSTDALFPASPTGALNAFITDENHALMGRGGDWTSHAAPTTP